MTSTSMADGHRAVSASHDRTLRLWNLGTGQEIASSTRERERESNVQDISTRSHLMRSSFLSVDVVPGLAAMAPTTPTA